MVPASLSFHSNPAGPQMCVKLDACPLGRGFKIRKLASLTENLGTSIAAASVLGPGAGESKHASPLRAFSHFTRGLKPHWFSKLSVSERVRIKMAEKENLSLFPPTEPLKLLHMEQLSLRTA